ncbi:DUF1987 domain-containing protein [Azonexus hydrophilus]|uniref:DUF1987 domain-containing protein n=1 Tax=Azonexus hydrophilus TaxID=418702 RepID=UPI0004283A47|nr:DUF1987 domain-containing protein [Azonexus hydrophilus]
METLYIGATPSSPEVNFDFAKHHLSIRGESYPENAAAFYGEIIKRLREYLGNCSQTRITVDISLAYFNSSSTKMLFNIFEAFNSAVTAGNEIVLNWYHDEEDDTILEFGQELHIDFPLITFFDHPVKTA